MFSFLNPLAVEIWLWMGCAYILVSLTIWLVARFSPKEWTLPQVCPCSTELDDIPEEHHEHLLSSLLVLENDFTLGNAFWFTIGSLMQQGSELNPKVILS
jgi:ionotropic kainate glutamate receptor 2